MVQHLLVIGVDGNAEFSVFWVGSSPFDLMGSGTADCDDLDAGDSVQERMDVAFALRWRFVRMCFTRSNVYS